MSTGGENRDDETAYLADQPEERTHDKLFIYHKRLENGVFSLPWVDDENTASVSIGWHDLMMMVQQVKVRRRYLKLYSLFHPGFLGGFWGFQYLHVILKPRYMSNSADKDLLVEALLQERDELYLELSRLRDIASGPREKQLDEIIRQKDAELLKKDDKNQEKEDQIRKLTDQLAWYRHKFWKPASEKYIPRDPNQRIIDFEGLDVLPQEEEAIKEAQTEIISYERKKPEREKKQLVRANILDSTFFISTHITEVAEKVKSVSNIQFKYFDSKLVENIPTYEYKLENGISHERLGLYI